MRKTYAELSCPTCHSLNGHIQTVFALEGEPGEPDSQGIHGELFGLPVGGQGPERRGAVVVEVECEECPVRWQLVLQAHKGQILASCRVTK